MIELVILASAYSEHAAQIIIRNKSANHVAYVLGGEISNDGL